MARRRRMHLIDPKAALGLLMAIGAIWLIVLLLEQIGGGIVLAVLLGGAAALAYPVIRHLRRVHARRTLLEKAQAIVDEQLSPLVIKRAQLVWQDEYGKLQVEKWSKEKDRFIAQHIKPLLTPMERWLIAREVALIVSLIENRVDAGTQDQAVFRAFSDAMTPAEFENFCAEGLRRAGWAARVTMRSRDQGVDVVAEKDDVKVVIQCKLYARPVGNKAVQEVAAAKAHEQASHGIVVTNSSYTLAARHLAHTNGVRLLHYSQLRNLQNLLR
jgi:restriction system protein